MEKSTLSIKETLSITFRTLKILFHAAPGGIVFLGILSTIAGVCPFLTLILSRAFLDSLARACGQQAFEMEIIWLLFFLFLTNMMLSVVNNLSILLKSDVSGRISLLVNAQVLEKCVHLPMSQYDNETTYNRIRFTSEQTSIRCTNLINTVFSIVQCLISFASVVCVLVSFNGIIVIASVVASIPLFFVNKYVSSFWYKISVGRVEKQRYSDVLRDLMLRNDNIKELKLFGSLSYLKSRILNQQTDFFREDQMNRKKFCKIDTAQKAANDFVILLLKLWIIILGIKQRATLGTINLYTSSLDQIQSAIFSFCTQLNTFYEQALYLESLFDLFDMQTEDENCGTPLTEPIRTIEFRHVYFSYPATNEANQAQATVTQAQLDIARAELSALQSLKAADCVLSAPEDGTLTQLNLEAGQNSTSVAGLLADRNAASVLTFSLEQASARLATVGTQITVKQGSQSMQTTVTALSDPSEEGSIQITAMLHSGDWKAGSATVEIKLNAGQYEQCLPATAIQTDSSGMFVYLVEERATLLGIQNVLIRLPVTVEAQGDGMAAVSGSISGQVVTGADKPLSEGSWVRVAS